MKQDQFVFHVVSIPLIKQQGLEPDLQEGNQYSKQNIYGAQEWLVNEPKISLGETK